mgnify:CR=1 FL=1
MLRYAACREDRNEARAQRYFNAMQSQKESETALAGEDAAKMQKLLDALDSLDDVQEVYTTAAMDE